MKITVSVIKADVGGIGGHTRPSDGLLGAVRKTVENSKDLLIDSYIGYCGDDVHIVMTHTKGVDNQRIHELAWKAFEAGTQVAKQEGLYGAGQDLLKDSFSGNAKGVKFNVMDVEEGKIAELNLWEDKPTLEAALMYPGRYVVASVYTKDNEPIVSSSTDRLHNIAGKYVGKDDPICIVRTQKNFPATEEAGSAFNNPHYVAGNTRGSHHMPLMPVKLNSAATIDYCIPIVEALVFSMHNGKLVGPHDGFSTPDWDYIREIATKRALAIRSQGFIHPATLIPSELEYAEGYKDRMKVLENKMKSLPGSSSKGRAKGNYEDPD